MPKLPPCTNEEWEKILQDTLADAEETLEEFGKEVQEDDLPTQVKMVTQAWKVRDLRHVFGATPAPEDPFSTSPSLTSQDPIRSHITKKFREDVGFDSLLPEHRACVRDLIAAMSGAPVEAYSSALAHLAKLLTMTSTPGGRGARDNNA